MECIAPCLSLILVAVSWSSKVHRGYMNDYMLGVPGFQQGPQVEPLSGPASHRAVLDLWASVAQPVHKYLVRWKLSKATPAAVNDTLLSVQALLQLPLDVLASVRPPPVRIWLWIQSRENNISFVRRQNSRTDACAAILAVFRQRANLLSNCCNF